MDDCNGSELLAPGAGNCLGVGATGGLAMDHSWLFWFEWPWVDLGVLPLELAHFRSLVLLELVPMVSLSHMLALLVLMAPVDLEFYRWSWLHFVAWIATGAGSNGFSVSYVGSSGFGWLRLILEFLPVELARFS